MPSSSGSGGSESERSDECLRARRESKEAFKLLLEMSNILNCGLSPNALGYCIRLIEDGVDPRLLSRLIKRWKRAGAGTGAGTPLPSTSPLPNGGKTAGTWDTDWRVSGGTREGHPPAEASPAPTQKQNQNTT